MLMLEDVKNRPVLLTCLEQAIQSNKYCIIVSNGSEVLDKKMTLNSDEIKHCVVSFKTADLAFIGANHGNIISPLFALSVGDNQNIATLKEYLTIPSVDENSRQVSFENDLTALSVVISVLYPDIQKIKLPLKIDEFSNQECNVKHSYSNCFLNILKH